MGYIKAVVLLVLLLFFGMLAVIVSLPAILLNQRWRFLNQVFLKPFGICARRVIGIQRVVLNLPKIHAHRPAVLLGNHQTGMDLGIIGSVCPMGTVIVAKHEIKHIPLFGWYFQAAGNLMIDRANPIEAKRALKDTSDLMRTLSMNLAIFPEGTRNTGKRARQITSDSMLPFKKGGFHLAKDLNLPIIPVVCSNLRGRAIWESFELKGGTVIISVLDAVDTQDWDDATLPIKIEEIRQKMMDEFTRISRLAEAIERGETTPDAIE